MKKLLLSFVAGLVAAFPAAHAADTLPYLTPVRAEVLEQLNLATNGVAEPDKKLVSTLQKALATIDKTKPTYATGAKSVGSLAKALNRTAVSNEFVSAFESVVSLYVSTLAGEEDTLANRLAAAFPSKSKTSAIAALERLLNALDGANTNSDFILAAKYLATASKELGSAAKLTVKAEAADAPPAEIEAQVTGSENFSIQAIAGIVPGASLIVSGAEPAGAGFRQLNFVCDNAPDGTSTVTVSSGNVNTLIGGVSKNYGNGTGTATITRNNATQFAFGSFTFTAQGIGGTAGSVTVTGTFSGNW